MWARTKRRTLDLTICQLMSMAEMINPDDEITKITFYTETL